MDPSGVYLAVSIIYGLLGVALSSAYHVSPRLRDEPAFHGFTVILMFVATALALVGSRIEFTPTPILHSGARFFLFVSASLAYVPAVLFLVLHYFELAMERILSAGSRRAPPPPPATQKEQWNQIQAYMETLSDEPSAFGVRERLGDLYLQMGFLDSAVYEYQKAADWVERGYAHGHLLYKAAWVIVERKKKVESALILLRRIVRLYPKSYFAAYARRVLNHFEAHSGISNGRHRDAPQFE